MKAELGTPDAKRPIQLENVRLDIETERPSTHHIWYDAREMTSPVERQRLLARLPNFGYTGVLLSVRNYQAIQPSLSSSLRIAVMIESLSELESLADQEAIVASSDPALLERASQAGRETCLRQYVDDGESLHRSIHHGKKHSILMICFRDPTNIPLELVIASLQPTQTTLIKEVSRAEDLEDAVVSLGVMEVGADGVMYSPDSHARLEAFSQRLSARSTIATALEPATIIRSVPIGMGYRSCIDLATLFSPKEGMLVGSTSQGAVLCCPEVFFLPYMELRPFRVNAGAVHSYVYNVNNRTDYMSELRSGSPVMIVGIDGQSRTAAVGRMKTELRPLRLIEAGFAGGEAINVIMQDDWHVRIFSPEGEPLNVTELKPGDRVLAHKAQPGRHVGIKIEEHILET